MYRSLRAQSAKTARSTLKAFGISTLGIIFIGVILITTHLISINLLVDAFATTWYFIIIAIAILAVIWIAIQNLWPPQVLLSKEGFVLEKPAQFCPISDIRQIELFQAANGRRLLKIVDASGERLIGVAKRVDVELIARILERPIPVAAPQILGAGTYGKQSSRDQEDAKKHPK
jgi:hypothetical protein